MRIGILADIHANLDALKAAICDDAGQAVDHWWVLGDVVGRGPEPVATVRYLRERVDTRGWQVGNHDACVCGLVQPALGSVRDAELSIWQDHRSQLRTERTPVGRPLLWEWCRRTWTWQRTQPRLIETHQADCWLVHAALGEREHNVGDRSDSYIVPWQTPEQRGVRAQQFERLDALRREERPLVLIHGHTHIPYIAVQLWKAEVQPLLPIHYNRPQRLDQFPSYLINPGSVGQPRNGDAQVHAAYGILDTAASTFEFRRVPYDSERVRLAMAARDYDISLIHLLMGNHHDHPLRPNNSWWLDWQRTYQERPWGWEPVDS